MILFERYINGVDHVWYESKNVAYSKCYDLPSKEKNVKVVFQNGKTYLYKGVDVEDYLRFKAADSSGSAVQKFIAKKYKGLRIADTDMDMLARKMKEFQSEDADNRETKFSDLLWHIRINPNCGEFALFLYGREIYHGVEGKVSIVNLLNSMNISYSCEVTENVNRKEEEKEDEVRFDEEEEVGGEKYRLIPSFDDDESKEKDAPVGEAVPSDSAESSPIQDGNMLDEYVRKMAEYGMDFGDKEYISELIKNTALVSSCRFTIDDCVYMSSVPGQLEKKLVETANMKDDDRTRKFAEECRNAFKRQVSSFIAAKKQ